MVKCGFQASFNNLLIAAGHTDSVSRCYCCCVLMIMMTTMLTLLVSGDVIRRCRPSSHNDAVLLLLMRRIFFYALISEFGITRHRCSCVYIHLLGIKKTWQQTFVNNSGKS